MQDLTPFLTKAGLLGHKLSTAVGDALFDLFKAADIDSTVTIGLLVYKYSQTSRWLNLCSF